MTYEKGDRGECLKHSRIRCSECEYVSELEEELYGTKHHYGYKQMYAICNRDYAKLHSEKERYKQALMKISSVDDPYKDYHRMWEIAWKALKGLK